MGLPAQRCSSPALWSQGLTSGHAFVTFTNGPWAAPSSLLASGHLWNCRVGVTATGTFGEEPGLQSVRPVRCKAGRTDPDPNSWKPAGTGGFSKYQRAVWFSYRKSDLEKCEVLSLPAVFILPPRRRFSSTRTSGLTHVPSAGITSKQ